MDELYAIFLSWAVMLTGYPMPDRMPAVELVPRSYLQQAACKGHQCKVMGWFPPGQTTTPTNTSIQSTICSPAR